MIRSLHSAASAMRAQQTAIDTTANNLANVNTQGFKKSRAQFEDLLTQGLVSTDRRTPVAGAIGVGSRVASIFQEFTQGGFMPTGQPLDVAIDGEGFFVIETPDGERYTRNGAFQLDEAGSLVTAQGFYVLDERGRRLQIPAEASDVRIEANGALTYFLDGERHEAGVLGVVTFTNPAGLDSRGANLYALSDNAGQRTPTAAQLATGALEGSNVDLAEEMVNLMMAQRAYQFASRAVQTSDELMAMANQLKRT